MQITLVKVIAIQVTAILGEKGPCRIYLDQFFQESFKSRLHAFRVNVTVFINYSTLVIRAFFVHAHVIVVHLTSKTSGKAKCKVYIQFMRACFQFSWIHRTAAVAISITISVGLSQTEHSRCRRRLCWLRHAKRVRRGGKCTTIVSQTQTRTSPSLRMSEPPPHAPFLQN